MTETTEGLGLPPVIDFDALLAPLPGDSPGGPDLREDPSESRRFYEVRELRKAEIDNERMLLRFSQMSPEDLEYELGLLQSDPRRPPKWDVVVQRATEILEKHSKDLWVAAWLAEALVRQHGIAGARDGLRLCRLLCENFWDSLQPRPNEEEGGWEWTLSQLDGLNVTLKAAIEAAPLLPGHLLAPRERTLTLTTYAEAQRIAKLSPEERSERAAAGAALPQDFEEAVRRADEEELRAIRETARGAVEEAAAYYQTLQKLVPEGDEIPAVSGIEETLGEFTNRFEVLTKSRLGGDEAEAGAAAVAGYGDAADGSGSMATASFNGLGGAAKAGMTREDALEGLLRVADFFRRTEPHSPVSYALEQAVRWGRMPLPMLLQDLMGEGEVRDQVFRRLGIREDEGSERDGYRDDEE